MNSKNSLIVTLIIVTISSTNGGSSVLESFDVWTYFYEKIIHTFDNLVGDFVMLINSLDHYINHSWDKVTIMMDRMVDHVREEDCYFACPKGLRLNPKPDHEARIMGCTVFGYEVPSRHLVERHATESCCYLHNQCYQTCGENKWNCDDSLIDCLRSICPKVVDENQRHPCDVSIKVLEFGAFSFSCRHFRRMQNSSCICQKDEL